VSHRLSEITAIADRVTVMRDGAKVATMAAGEVTEESLIRAMVGRFFDPHARRERAFYRQPRDAFVISSKIGRILRRPLKPGPIDRDEWIGSRVRYLLRLQLRWRDAVVRGQPAAPGHRPHRHAAHPRSRSLALQGRDQGHGYMNQLYTSGWRALEELRDQGVIGGIGAGFNLGTTINRCLDMFDMDFFLLAMRYTLLEQEVLDSEFPNCEKRNVGIVIGGTYNSGILATGAVPGARYNYAPADPQSMTRVAKMEAVCRRHNVPLAAAALQFPLGHKLVAAVIPGAISTEQVQQNLAAFNCSIPQDLWAELKHEKLIRGDAPTPTR